MPESSVVKIIPKACMGDHLIQFTISFQKVVFFNCPFLQLEAQTRVCRGIISGYSAISNIKLRRLLSTLVAARSLAYIDKQTKFSIQLFLAYFFFFCGIQHAFIFMHL